MTAAEAAKHADVLQQSSCVILYKTGTGRWLNQDGKEVKLRRIEGNWIPLVPKPIYKVGDQVPFLEACQSGLCFKTDEHKYTLRWQVDGLNYFDHDRKTWSQLGWTINWFYDAVCTLIDDPSIPPKPTLDALPAWTRCKVKVVGSTTVYDVHKLPGETLFTHETGGQFCMDNPVFELVAIFDPKAETWNDV